MSLARLSLVPLALRCSLCFGVLYLIADDSKLAVAGPATPPVGALDAVGEIDLAEALLLSKQDGTIFVDVRSPDAFASGRIRNAINLPLADIERGAHTEELRKFRNIVLYCDSRSCTASHRAARVLGEQLQRSVLVYLGGWGQWRQLDLPHDS